MRRIPAVLGTIVDDDDVTWHLMPRVPGDKWWRHWVTADGDSEIHALGSMRLSLWQVRRVETHHIAGRHVTARAKVRARLNRRGDMTTLLARARSKIVTSELLRSS